MSTVLYLRGVGWVGKLVAHTTINSWTSFRPSKKEMERQAIENENIKRSAFWGVSTIFLLKKKGGGGLAAVDTQIIKEPLFSSPIYLNLEMGLVKTPVIGSDYYYYYFFFSEETGAIRGGCDHQIRATVATSSFSPNQGVD